MESYAPHYYEFARDEGDWKLFPRREVLEFVHAQLRPNLKILDIGCGTAEILSFLPENINYTGIERSQYAVSEAQKRWSGEHRESKFISLEAESLPLPDKGFDIVLMLFSLEHVRNPRKILSECARVASLNGHILILAPNLELPTAWPNALRHRSLLYRIVFFFIRLGDYIKRLLGIYTFRTIGQNFSEFAGRYERKDDDLTYVASSWEIIKFMQRSGFRLKVFWEENELPAFKRALRFIPTLRWYGVPLAAVFEREGETIH